MPFLPRSHTREEQAAPGRRRAAVFSEALGTPLQKGLPSKYLMSSSPRSGSWGGIERLWGSFSPPIPHPRCLAASEFFICVGTAQGQGWRAHARKENGH